MMDARIEPATPFTESDLNRIELHVGRPLPTDYRDFVTNYGGAFVGGLVDGNTELPILTFFGVDQVLSRLDWYPDLRNDGVLPVADCALGNLYVIVRDNTVHYINYYGGRTTSQKVAASFGDLLARIVVSDE